MTAYCGRYEVKAPGRLDISASTYDAEIDSIIDAASALIDKYCAVPDGGFAVAGDTTRYYDGENLHCGVLSLDSPCISVTTLTDASGFTFASNAYRLWPFNQTPKRKIHLLSGWAWNWIQDGRITVTGKFGYATDPPAPIREACAIYTGWLFKRWQAALQDATANAELGQVIYSSDMPKQVKSILNFYKDGTKLL